MIKRIKTPEGSIISLRHRNGGFDYISNKDYRFIQLGKQPVKFISIKKRSGKHPVFLKSVGWTIVRSLYKDCVRVGLTFRPYNLSNFWKQTKM